MLHFVIWRKNFRCKSFAMWTTFIVLVLTVLASLARTENGHCPPMVCSCQDRSANCSQRGLIKLPPGLPLRLKNLDLSQNKMDSINSTMLLLMSDLEVLDLSLNFLSELRFDGAHYKLRYHSYITKAQNLIWLPNFLLKLGFFSSKQKSLFFNITFWQNFHDVIWNF